MSHRHPHLEHDLVAVSLIPAAAWFAVTVLARQTRRVVRRARRDAELVTYRLRAHRRTA